MEYATSDWKISEDVLLTVQGGVWRYLTSEMDPDDDYLVLSWSLHTGWMAGVLPRTFPADADDAVAIRLNEFTLLVQQSNLLQELNGRALQYEGGMLSVA